MSKNLGRLMVGAVFNWLLLGLVILNLVLVGIAYLRGGVPLGQSEKTVLIDGLRADLVLVERPWLQVSSEADNNSAPSSKLIDLEKAKEDLDQAIESGASKVVAEMPPPPICFRWGPLLPDQVLRVKDSLSEWAGASEVSEDKAVVGYIVFVPKEAVDAGMNVQRLQELGVTDLFYMRTTGPVQGAISLGIFRDLVSAQQQQSEMQAKGVTDVQIGERYGPTRTYLTLLGDQAQIDDLREIYRLNRQGLLSPCEPDSLGNQ